MNPHPQNRHINRGFTVVEILVAMVISLLLLAGILTLFSNSRTAYENNDRLARIQENGRLALDLIARDVRGAGYWGCAKRTAAKPLRNVLNSSTSLLWNFGVPVEGFDATTTAWSPALVAPITTDNPTLLSDVLVVRGPKRDTSAQVVQTNMTGTADIVVYTPSAGMALNDIAIAASCDQASVFQITSYSTGTGIATIKHAASGTPGNASADVNGQYFADQAQVFPVETVVYFVGPGTAPAPGVTSTSLWRRHGSTVEEVVEGVDSFQVAFGLDTDNNRLADTYANANAVTNWDQVVSVRVALLMRSLTEYGSDTDNVARTLLGQSTGPFGDRRQRLVFTTTMTLRNKVF